MTTSLTATPLPDQAAVRLRLESTSAVSGPVVMNEFDSSPAARDAETARWTVQGLEKADLTFYSPETSYQIQFARGSVPDVPTPGYARRVVTGLTVGVLYRVSLAGLVAYGQPWSLGVVGVGSRTIYTGVVSGFDLDGPYLYEFEATATSHTIEVSLTDTSASGYLYLSGIRVNPQPGALIRVDTDFPSSEDAAWTVAGTPTGGASSAVSDTISGNRMFGRQWTRTSGAPNFNGASLRRNLTGLTVDQSYSVRLYAYASGVIDAATTPVQMTVGVVGMDPTTPTTWPSWRWVDYTFTATATSHVLAVAIAEPVTFDSPDDTFTLWMDYLRVEEVVSNTGLLVSLTRSDDNGTASVRLFEGQGLSGGLLVANDYEASLVGLVTYTAVVATNGNQQETATAAFTDLGTQRAVLAPSTMPQYLQMPRLITGFEGTRTSRTTVHEVVNREDPLVILGPLGTRRGNLDIYVDEYALGRALEDVYARGEIVLLRQPFDRGLDMYHVAQSTSLGRDQTAWRLSVTYVETKAPTGPLLGSLGWTFDQAATSYPTFAAARTAFPTFNQYTTGPVA